MVKYHTQERKSPTQNLYRVFSSRSTAQNLSAVHLKLKRSSSRRNAKENGFFLFSCGLDLWCAHAAQYKRVAWTNTCIGPDTRWCIVCGCVRAADTNQWAQNCSVELVLQSHIYTHMSGQLSVLALRCTNAKRIYYASFVLNAVGFLPHTKIG